MPRLSDFLFSNSLAFSFLFFYITFYSLLDSVLLSALLYTLRLSKTHLDVEMACHHEAAGEMLLLGYVSRFVLLLTFVPIKNSASSLSDSSSGHCAGRLHRSALSLAGRSFKRALIS